MAPTTSSLIPADHTFLNPKTFMSKRAHEFAVGLLEKADNRNPDAFGMYIYNDYFNYALLDLVDKTLSTIHAKIVKKNFDEALILLEALTVFNDLESSWPTCDDGERTELTNKAFGACLVATLRGLKTVGRLDVANFPSLETILRNAADWGEAMEAMGAGSPYYIVCKGIGKRLFKDKSIETIALEKARVEEWISELDKDGQKLVQGLMEAEDEEEDATWYAGGNEDDADEDYAMSRVWKEYKGRLANCSRKPLGGAGTWDINKWSAAQKWEFSLDNDGGMSF